MLKPYIHTVNGKAYFERTIIEDKYRNWDDSSYSTIRGYWVIHEGNKHHIYKIKNKFAHEISEKEIFDSYTDVMKKYPNMSQREAEKVMMKTKRSWK